MTRTVAQAGKFGLVGLFSTAVDFVLINLIHEVFGLSLIEANLISTTIAMMISFFINRRYVFNTGSRPAGHQAVAFLLVTAFGLYVIQTVIIHVLTVSWTSPIHLAIGIVGAVGLGKVISDNFVITNFTKLVATLVTMVWNFLFYKRVVFV